MSIKYRIYKIIHTNINQQVKCYVGLTVRDLKVRLGSHIAEKSRKKHVTKGSLGEAIRQEFSANPHCAAFVITELQECDSVAAMRDAEKQWIAELNTSAPNGYNLMPGGASVGGPSNSKPVEVVIDEAKQTFDSMAELCRAFCHDGDERQYYYRIVARIKAGWTIEQALGLEAHVDGRTTDLSAQALASGENLATVRSRRHRQEKAAISPAPGSYALPDPDNLGATISASAFAKKTGQAVSTIRHRARNLQSLAITDPAAAVEALTNGFDRSKCHSITLEDQTILSGSLRQLAKLASRGAHASGTLSENAIRKRLALLPDNPDPDQLLCAIGHKAPPLSKSLSTAAPVLRRVHCADWTVTFQGRTQPYANQMSFCRSCYAAMKTYAVPRKYPKTLDMLDPEIGIKQLQRWVSAQTADKKKMTPTEIASALNVLEHIVPPKA